MNRLMEHLADCFSPMEIGFTDFGLSESEIVFLDKMEASVYKVGSKAFKVYDGFMSHLIDVPILRRYQDLTQQTPKILLDNPEIERDFGYRIKVVQIEQVGRLREKTCACSVSDFVPGENIHSRYYRMSGEEKGALIARFELLNLRLQEKLRSRHARIDFNNAKLDEANELMIVTDMCGEISRMSSAFENEPPVFYLG